MVEQEIILRFVALRQAFRDASDAYRQVYRTERVRGGLIVEYIHPDPDLVAEREAQRSAASREMEQYGTAHKAIIAEALMSDGPSLHR